MRACMCVALSAGRRRRWTGGRRSSNQNILQKTKYKKKAGKAEEGITMDGFDGFQK